VTTLFEGWRRAASRRDGRLRTLPILALTVHSACNCRCVMCDIWKANVDKRELTPADLERHVSAIRGLRVRRVMLTGGEPLLHRNLWALCDRLRAEDIRLTLVTTGLLIEAHAAAIARTIDEVVVSVDGPPAVHDAIRRVRGGFDRVARGVDALLAQQQAPHTVARCVVQQANHAVLGETADAIAQAGFDQVSFLAADVSSTAFNRPDGWSGARQEEILVGRAHVGALETSIRDLIARFQDRPRRRFLAGGPRALWRIHAYYRALAGEGSFPEVRCNAPWISAVLEPGDVLRPCFFLPPYSAHGLDGINADESIAFRRGLDVQTNETCRRCVCSLSLPLLQRV
jgi:Fe-coproporphyrin III synthase